MNISRRRLFVQVFAAAGVAVTGKLFWIDSEEFVPDIFIGDDAWLFLSQDDLLVLSMIIPVLLDGVLSELLADKLAGKELVSYLKDLDYNLSMLPILQQKEFKELLSLLHSLIGRVVLAGIWTSWNNVSAQTIEEMLNNWRTSYINLLKVAYTGLKEISFATWYGNSKSWHGIGYPGPPEILR